MLKEVGLSDGAEGDDPGLAGANGQTGGKASDASPKSAKPAEEPKVWLHCNVGPRIDVKDETAKEESAEEVRLHRLLLWLVLIACSPPHRDGVASMLCWMPG